MSPDTCHTISCAQQISINDVWNLVAQITNDPTFKIALAALTIIGMALYIMRITRALLNSGYWDDSKPSEKRKNDEYEKPKNDWLTLEEKPKRGRVMFNDEGEIIPESEQTMFHEANHEN